MAHILIIEPDSKLARIYSAALESCGHSIDSCVMAQNAISLADGRTPDLVMLELGLTAHGGIEFLYEFRSYADWRDVPVVVVSHVSADALSGSRELLTGQLGVKAYHYKPRLSLRSLVASVERVLEARASHAS